MQILRPRTHGIVPAIPIMMIAVAAITLAACDTLADRLFTVRGVVIDARTRQPLAHVKIRVESSGNGSLIRSAQTNTEGRYEMRFAQHDCPDLEFNLLAPQGTHVVASRAGYHMQSQRITCGENEEVDFALQPENPPSENAR